MRYSKKLKSSSRERQGTNDNNFLNYSNPRWILANHGEGKESFKVRNKKKMKFLPHGNPHWRVSIVVAHLGSWRSENFPFSKLTLLANSEWFLFHVLRRLTLSHLFSFSQICAPVARRARTQKFVLWFPDFLSSFSSFFAAAASHCSRVLLFLCFLSLFYLLVIWNSKWIYLKLEWQLSWMFTRSKKRKVTRRV